MEPKKAIIDFDGTLCDFVWPDAGKKVSKPNVKEGLQRLIDAGFRIIIHSVRTATYWKNEEDRIRHLKIIQDFMEENNLPYDEILVGINYDKPVGDVYIDDRGVAYRGDWLQTAYEAIKLGGKGY